MERLQRVLASAGIASRRRAEELILEGRVRVDGVIVTELGTRVDPGTQKIEVDGKLIPTVRRRYILLHKPSGYITTTSDERSRYTVMDLVPVDERVVPVGRLDRQTEGLLLLTNDGEVAHRVMHPRYGIDKEYEALLDGYPPPEVLDRLRRGIVIDGQRTSPEMIRPLRNTEDGTIVRIVIHEGRNRIVRKMFEEVGYPVVKLVRTRVGPLQLGAIPRGTFRDLTDGELKALREALHMTDEDVIFSEHVVDRPLRDRPDPSRMKTGRDRLSNADRDARGGRIVRTEGQRGRPPTQQRAAERGRPSRDSQHVSSPQARMPSDRPAQSRSDRQGGGRQPSRNDDQGRQRSERLQEQRNGGAGRPSGRPSRRNDDRRTDRTGSGSGDTQRDRSSGPPRGRRGSGGQSGPGRRSTGQQRPGNNPPRSQQRSPRRNETPTQGAGGGGDRPPDHDRDRRSSGGGQEHRRRDRRSED